MDIGDTLIDEFFVLEFCKSFFKLTNQIWWGGGSCGRTTSLRFFCCSFFSVLANSEFTRNHERNVISYIHTFFFNCVLAGRIRACSFANAPNLCSTDGHGLHLHHAGVPSKMSIPIDT